MLRHKLSQPTVIIVILILQFIPLGLYPASSFGGDTQEWWLPALLAILALWAVIDLIFRKNTNLAPWYLISFAQGFNIISRIMLLMPHATKFTNGQQVVNWTYIILTLVSMAFSAFMLWFSELPEVRLNMIKRQS